MSAQLSMPPVAGGGAAQPLDADLSAIAALSTTAYGRALLTGSTVADLTALGLQGADSDLAAVAALSTTAYGRAFLTVADQAALVALLPSYQPLDSDLTYLAGFTPAAHVKNILNAADYAAIKTLMSLVPGTDIQAFHANLAALAAATAPGTTGLQALATGNSAALTALISAATTSLSGAMSALDKTTLSTALPSVQGGPVVQTTNATITTLNAAQLASGKQGIIMSVVVALKDDFTVGAAWMYVFAARNNAGTLSAVGVQTQLFTPLNDAGATTWVVTQNFTGTTMRTRATGQAATNINWFCVQFLWTN